MKTFAMKVLCLLGSLTVFAIAPVGAENTAQENSDAAQESVEAASDAQRVRRIREVIEFDRARLEQAKADQPQRQALFDQLAEVIAAWKADQQEKRLRLEQTSDPEKRESLEREIAKLDDELDLLRAQSELAFSSLTTVSQQIGVLEKKIEREQRTVDTLLGVAPEVMEAAPPAGAPVDQQPAVIPAPTDELMAPARTAAQIEANREFSRRQRVADEAEQDLIEFVKRKRSLKQQMTLEAKLLDTARESEGSLTRLLETRRADLELARAVDPNGEDALRYQRGIAFLEGLLERVRDEIDDRAVYLDSLNERLEKLAMEEQAVTRNLENARKLVADARARLNRLESPLHPQNLAHWARERGPRILMLLGTLAVLLVFVRFGIRGLVRLLLVRTDKGGDSGSDRADTLAFSFRSAMTFLIVIGGIFLLLEEAGVDVRTVLGGAAIVGIAVAFGAQNLMRDYFTGFVILLEKQFELGDLVTIAGVTGVVESVNMRATMLRDLEGRVHFIPNGEIKSVTNRTYHWGRAMVEIPIGYQENVDRVMETLAEIAKEVRKDPKYSERITEDPIMLGVDEFAQEGVVIKLMMKTVPEDVTAIRRELLRRIKNRFDEVGIGIRGEEPPRKAV
jgi:small conductance mechanosensitive channel